MDAAPAADSGGLAEVGCAGRCGEGGWGRRSGRGRSSSGRRPGGGDAAERGPFGPDHGVSDGTRPSQGSQSWSSDPPPPPLTQERLRPTLAGGELGFVSPNDRWAHWGARSERTARTWPPVHSAGAGVPGCAAPLCLRGLPGRARPRGARSDRLASAQCRQGLSPRWW